MRICLFLVLIIFLNASLIEDFKNKNYYRVCNYSNIKNYKNNEKILSLIGVACVKIDRLYLLPSVINKLKHTKEGLNNAIYFLTIYSQKKLLYSFLFNNLSLKDFDFPLTDHVLSIVFDAIKNKKFIKRHVKYIVHYKNIMLVLYKKNDKMFIDEIRNFKLIKRHWYR